MEMTAFALAGKCGARGASVEGRLAASNPCRAIRSVRATPAMPPPAQFSNSLREQNLNWAGGGIAGGALTDPMARQGLLATPAPKAPPPMPPPAQTHKL